MTRSLPYVLLTAVTVGCAHVPDAVQDPPRAVAAKTGATSESLIYLARTDSGVVVIGLGWFGAERAIRRGLERLGARPDDVVAAFLTHSHRDHMAGWPAVRGATFHLGAAEVPRFLGEETHRGPVPRALAAILPARRPDSADVRIHAFASDTVFAFGRDTVRAFLVPGHTPGSAAYLMRGILFVGDAIGHKPIYGFHGADWIFADDVGESRRSVRSLWRRVEPYGVEWVCTAHGKCARPDDALRRAAER